jgi:hypothetical protein
MYVNENVELIYNALKLIKKAMRSPIDDTWSRGHAPVFMSCFRKDTVVRINYTTQSPHRCTGCLAPCHWQRDRAPQDFSEGIAAAMISASGWRGSCVKPKLPVTHGGHAAQPLNALRAKQVASLKQLDRWRYSGHSGLMGDRSNDWQARDAVLRFLGTSVSRARRQYRHFVEQGIARGYDSGYALARVAQLSGVAAEQILRAGKQPARVYARSLLCHWAIRSLGMTAVAVPKLLEISQPAVTRAAYRGEAIAAANSLKLVESHNA